MTFSAALVTCHVFFLILICRFMICCDQCGQWYHGNCVNVTEDEAQVIENFVCIACKEQGMQYFALFNVLILQILSTFI